MSDQSKDGTGSDCDWRIVGYAPLENYSLIRCACMCDELDAEMIDFVESGLCFPGIGLGIALKYLSEGDDVVLVGRSLDRLKSAIPSDFKGTGKALFLAKDVSTVRAPASPSFL